MKRKLITGFRQGSRSTFLKCRAPCAAVHSAGAAGRSPKPSPPTSASSAWSGATPPMSAPVGPYPNSISLLTHTPLKHIPSSKFAADFPHIDSTASVIGVLCARSACFHLWHCCTARRQYNGSSRSSRQLSLPSKPKMRPNIQRLLLVVCHRQE
jgi:hypothetical protein